MNPLQDHALWASYPALQFAVLVGSRATGQQQASSDWDIAVQWSPATDWGQALELTESLRLDIAKVLAVGAEHVDMIDLRRANLTMRASVAEEGQPLALPDERAWNHFLQRTWRDLEDFYWDRRHAA
jgi:predicted nucleotidyltransferase